VVRPPALWALLATALLAPVACLPEPDLPAHAKVSAYLTPSPATAGEPFLLEGGWTVHFTRTRAVVGSPDLYGMYCDTMTDSIGYGRLVTFHDMEPQKLGEAYALGNCGLLLASGMQPEDVIPGGELTQRDVDAFFADETQIAWPKDLEVAGEATQGDRRVSFHFARSNGVVEQCYGYDSSLQWLRDGDERRADYTLALEDMWSLIGGGFGSFDAFANADAEYGDANGVITTEEIARAGTWPMGSVLRGPSDWGCE